MDLSSIKNKEMKKHDNMYSPDLINLTPGKHKKFSKVDEDFFLVN